LSNHRETSLNLGDGTIIGVIVEFLVWNWNLTKKTKVLHETLEKWKQS